MRRLFWLVPLIGVPTAGFFLWRKFRAAPQREFTPQEILEMTEGRRDSVATVSPPMVNYVVTDAPPIDTEALKAAIASATTRATAPASTLSVEERMRQKGL